MKVVFFKIIVIYSKNDIPLSDQKLIYRFNSKDIQNKNNNNNGEHLYSAFSHTRAQSAVTLIITPIDQVSI